ncbi:MAG: CcmD family protein [Bacteroidota bacterium]
MKKFSKFLAFLFLQLVFIPSIVAQNNNPDFMQSIGKIYVVVAVIVTIFIGIVIYLFSLQKKIKQLEDQIND